MKIVFAGTPEFARVALQALHVAGHEISLVLTQPDRPAGRGMKLQASPVKQFALEHGLPLAQPRSLRLDGKYPDDAASAKTALEATPADVMVVAAYGLILPQWVLDLPRLGCLNIHASLLPRWRGAAPIHRAIEAGDAETGITIMQMDAGLDTGDMLLMEKIAIAANDSTGSLHDKLATLGGELIVRALQRAERGEVKAIPQPVEGPDSGITYAHKIDKAEAQIDWSHPAILIERRIRAFNPAPGAQTTLRSQNPDGGAEALKLWQAEATGASSNPTARPGTVLAAQDGVIRVQCGTGMLSIHELQRAGGKRMSAADFLRGQPLPADTVLGEEQNIHG